QPRRRRHLVDRDDAGVAELRGRPRLAVEPLERGRRGEKSGVGKLQRYWPAQLGIHRAPHLAEGAASDLLQQLKLARHPGNVERGSPFLVLDVKGAATTRAEDLCRNVVAQVEGGATIRTAQLRRRRRRTIRIRRSRLEDGREQSAGKRREAAAIVVRG